MGSDDAQEREQDWAAVAVVVRERLRSLKMTQLDLAKRASVSLATVTELVTARPRRRLPRTLAAVSEALDWPADRISAVLAGGVFPPDPEPPTTEDTLARLDEFNDRLERLEQRVEELHKHL